MSDNIKVLLVGCGYMGKEYVKVLNDMGICPLVVGNSQVGTSKFKEKTGIEALPGGLDDNIEKIRQWKPEFAIVATPILQLCRHTDELIDVGIKNILVEKPVGLDLTMVQGISNKAAQNSANVYVAYNRRFYASVDGAKRIIENDGGLKSMIFEFTEWADKIADIENPLEEKRNWLLANSTHVIDLAFYLGGMPREIKCFTGGEDKLDWHPQAAIYSGAGVTEKDVLFSYSANWDGPGRWSLEFITKYHRLILKPLEELKIQDRNSVVISDYSLEDSADKEFKPGLYQMVSAFLNHKKGVLKTINDHCIFMQTVDMIARLNMN